MRLVDLMRGIVPPGHGMAGAAAVDISGITADSRRVAPGFLFAALPGTRVDGRAFIGAAVKQGAAAILAPLGTPWPADVPARPFLTDAEPRRALALLAANFAGAQPRTVVAITGTNGKTSSADFLRQIWQLSGTNAGSLGTLGLVAPGFPVGAGLTTPDPVALAQSLAALARAGIDRLAMEASSHGLDQYRLDGVRLAAAGFSNLTRDHMDYRGTTLRLLAARPLPHAQALAISRDGAPAQEVEIALPGRFQADNALLAAALAEATGVSDALVLLPHLVGVRGRMELAATLPNGAAAYVDYAHTPDALERLLTALRPHTAGKLVVVFGAGGDRDRGKRPLMGAVATRLADRAIVTDDNPRSEDPAAIRAAIRAACPGALEIGDREAAIAAGLALLGPGDVLAVAGKGHESGQTIGDTVLPFDDVAVLRRLAGMA